MSARGGEGRVGYSDLDPPGPVDVTSWSRLRPERASQCQQTRTGRRAKFSFLWAKSFWGRFGPLSTCETTSWSPKPPRNEPGDRLGAASWSGDGLGRSSGGENKISTRGLGTHRVAEVGGRSRDRGVIEKTKTSWSTGRGARGLGRSAGRERTGRAGGGGTRTSWSRGWGGSGGGWGSVEGQVVKQNRGGVDRGGRSTKPVGHRSSEPGRLWTWVASPRPDGSRVGGPFCKSRDRPVVGEPVGHRSGSAGRSKPVGPTRAGCEAGGGSARASWSPAGRNRGRSWTWW